MTLEEQLAALVTAVNEGRAATDAKLSTLQTAVDSWKPVVTDLQAQVEALQIRVDRFAPYFEGSSSSTPTATPGVDPDTERGGRSSSRRDDDDILDKPSGPYGHRQQPNTGGDVLGVQLRALPLVTGANLPPQTVLALPDPYEHREHHAHAHNWALPKLDFPAFDGENPQFWNSRCEKYFAVYGLQPDLWVRVAYARLCGQRCSLAASP